MANDLAVICNRCKARLWEHESPQGEVHWEHGRDADHEAEPVPATEADAILKCDFCLTPLKVPFWTYPAENFIMLISRGVGYTQHESIGAWAVCDTCHDFLQRGAINEMIEWCLQQHKIRPSDPDYRKVRVAFGNNLRVFLNKRVGEPFLENFSSVQETNE